MQSPDTPEIRVPCGRYYEQDTRLSDTQEPRDSVLRFLTFLLMDDLVEKLVDGRCGVGCQSLSSRSYVLHEMKVANPWAIAPSQNRTLVAASSKSKE